MPFYPAILPDVTTSCAEDAAAGLPGMLAVRVADLAWPARPGGDGRSALVAAGAGKIATGDRVVFFKPVVIAPAVVRRDGRVQANGHPAEHVRLGVAEDRLDDLAGQPGVISQIAAGLRLDGKVKGQARRAMTAARAIRHILLVTLMPDADYAEVTAALLGEMAGVPWQRPYQLPTATVICTWREAIGLEPLERLRGMVLAGIGAEHRDHDYRAVRVGDLDACSIDGSLTRVPDTPQNREAFGSAGTADDSAPYPQLRELRLSHASTRATLGVIIGPSGAGGSRDKGEAEQALLDKALKDCPRLFTAQRLWVMDRNFPGVRRISDMLGTGTHVLIRVKSDVLLKRTGDFLPDGSYLAVISGGGITVTVRVIEYWVTVAGADAPELFCLITDLHDHEAYPAAVLAGAYHWRWIGSETCLKEAKSAISGAGPSTGPILRSQSPALIRQEHAAWVISVELARAAARAAAAIAVPAGKGKRAGQPVHPREISFTAARRAVITSTRAGAATATARPKPGRASPLAGRPSPLSPRKPRSVSAARSPRDPASPVPITAPHAVPAWNRPQTRSDSRALAAGLTLRDRHGYRAAAGTATAVSWRSCSSRWHWGAPARQRVGATRLSRHTAAGRCGRIFVPSTTTSGTVRYTSW